MLTPKLLNMPPEIHNSKEFNVSAFPGLFKGYSFQMRFLPRNQLKWCFKDKLYIVQRKAKN